MLSAKVYCLDRPVLSILHVATSINAKLIRRVVFHPWSEDTGFQTYRIFL